MLRHSSQNCRCVSDSPCIDSHFDSAGTGTAIGTDSHYHLPDDLNKLRGGIGLLASRDMHNQNFEASNYCLALKMQHTFRQIYIYENDVKLTIIAIHVVRT